MILSAFFLTIVIADTWILADNCNNICSYETETQQGMAPEK